MFKISFEDLFAVFQIAIPQLKSLIYSSNANSEEANSWAEAMLVAATPPPTRDDTLPIDRAAIGRGLKKLITFFDSLEAKEKDADVKEKEKRRKKN